MLLLRSVCHVICKGSGYACTAEPDLSNTVSSIAALISYGEAARRSARCHRMRRMSNHANLKYILTPYIKGTSERVNKIFKPFNIKLSNKPTNTLKKSLCHLGDKRTPQEKTNLVY